MSFVCDHIHLRSPDPEAAAKTYVDLFEATVQDRVQVATGLRVIVMLGGLRLLIDEVPPETQPAPRPLFIGIEHIGLQVQNLDVAAANLRAKGAQFLMEPNSPRPGLRIAFVQGPDSIRIELLERSAQ
jgi:catechol 2,3-dioxygenase-like lactoylglutathione lyase family enzyme